MSKRISEANRTSRRRRFLVEALEARCLLSITVYVDAIAPGPVNDGSSWANAYTSLQTALGAAVSGETIEVGQGTYYPTSGTDRTATFQLIDRVAILGGFAGYGTANPDARNITAYLTTLSGDIGVIGNKSDNSYNIVTDSNTDSTALLDGFTIAGGNANGSGANQSNGGGIFISGGSPTINNCTFSGDTAAAFGSAMYNYAAAPIVTNCTFSGNNGGNGGVVYDQSASPTLDNCIFSGNGSGGMYNNSSSPALNNCTFIGNSGGANSVQFSGGCGAGMENINGSSPTLTNCLFEENTAENGGGMFNYFSSPVLTDCTFTENTAFNSGGGILDSDSSLVLVGCTLNSNAAYFDGGGIDNGNSSAILTSCTISGDHADYDGGGMDNFAYTQPSTITVTDCVINDDGATLQGGAIYNNASRTTLSVTINDCTIEGDSAEVGGAIENYSYDYMVRALASESIANSIIWGDGPNEIQNTIQRTGRSSTSANYSDIQGGIGGSGNINADPLFVNAAAGNVQLQPNSPCINAGSNAAIPAGITTDLAGDPRIAVAVVDMGAYEFQGFPASLGATPMFLAVDHTGGRILEIDSAGNATVLVSGLNLPYGIALDHNGNILVDESGAGEIETYSPYGVDLGIFATIPAGMYGLAVDGSGNVFVAGQSQILEFSASGQSLGVFASGLSASNQMAFDSDGNLYVTEGGIDVVEEFSPTGQDLGAFASGLGNPIPLAFDASGNLYVGEQSLNAVAEFSPGGQSLGVFTNTGLDDPHGLVFGSSGNLYAANYYSGTIQAYSSSGQSMGVFSSGLGNLDSLIPFAIDSWTGAGDCTSWGDPGNWSNQAVPTQKEIVTIPAGVPVVQVGGEAYSAGTMISSSPVEVLATGTLTLFGDATITSTLTVNIGGTVDIQSYSLTINYAAGADPAAAIRGYLKSAYSGGLWTGAGLTSSAVEAHVADAISNPGGGIYALGYLDGSMDGGQTTVTGDQMVIEPAIVGDTDLNGATNFLDLGRVAQNLGAINSDWYHGDFNYDGNVNFLDIGLLAQNLNKTTVNTPLGSVVSAGVVAATSGVQAAKNPGIEIPGRYLGGEGNTQNVVSGVWVPSLASESGLFGEETIGELLA